MLSADTRVEGDTLDVLLKFVILRNFCPGKSYYDSRS